MGNKGHRKSNDDKFIEPAEVVLLLDHVKDDPRDITGRNYMMMFIGANTGLRPDEICKLERRHCLRLSEGHALMVNRSKKRKNDPERDKLSWLPVNYNAAEKILEYINGNMLPGQPFLFVPFARKLTIRTKPLSYRMYNHLFKEYCAEVGLNPKYSPHALRHSFASRMAQNTRDRILVRDLMGHKTTKTTEVYFHSTKEARRTAVDELDIIE